MTSLFFFFNTRRIPVTIFMTQAELPSTTYSWILPCSVTEQLGTVTCITLMYIVEKFTQFCRRFDFCPLPPVSERTPTLVHQPGCCTVCALGESRFRVDAHSFCHHRDATREITTAVWATDLQQLLRARMYEQTAYEATSYNFAKKANVWAKRGSAKVQDL